MPRLHRCARRQRGGDGGGERLSSVVHLRGPVPPEYQPTGFSAAARGPSAPWRPQRPDERLLHPVGARMFAVVALTLFGAVHWMRMVEPPAPQRAWYAVGIALLVSLGLAAVRRRPALAGLVILAAVALAVPAAGGDDRLIAPAHWDQLFAGVVRGAEGLPGARVPYRGLDEWLRLVIPLGGMLLAVLAAALAFWPRREGRGFPVVALVALVTLYAVPAVALIFDREFVRGALLAVLVLAFLRLERLRRTDAFAAGSLAAIAAALALAVAPALDRIEPWWDYETWALSAGGSRSTTFAWDHEYGPLDWPRDGRELLRIRSGARTYWKADNLDLYDGDRWRREDFGFSRNAPSLFTEDIEERNLRRWTERMRVTVRNLRSDTFVVAGMVVNGAIEHPRRHAIQTGRAGIFATTRSLRRGDTYEALVYIPRPSERQLRRAGSDYDGSPGAYRRVVADARESFTVRNAITGALEAGRPTFVDIPGFGEKPVIADGVNPFQIDARATDLIAASSLRRAYELSQRLLGRSRTPYDYVKAIERALSSGYAYSERPPDASKTLDGFLFESKVGYCQQFSGAMALLLRLGGVPARVATGFAPGSRDEESKEYIVRDVDAHSWVEAWFPGIGWVPFDPTPTSAPPRSQADAESAASAAIGDIRDLGTATFDPRRGGEDESRAVPWPLIVGGGALLVGLLFTVRLWRRRIPSVAALELERALRVTRTGVGPSVTLSGLETRLARWPSAAAYVRALRAQRYGVAGPGPSASQRRALRRALARLGGRGPGPALRAWWALPPRLPRRGSERTR